MRQQAHRQLDHGNFPEALGTRHTDNTQTAEPTKRTQTKNFNKTKVSQSVKEEEAKKSQKEQPSCSSPTTSIQQTRESRETTTASGSAASSSTISWRNYSLFRKTCQPPTALHHLKILPGYITNVHKHKGEVMNCPDAAYGILKINANLDTFDDAFNGDDVIVRLGNAAQQLKVTKNTKKHTANATTTKDAGLPATANVKYKAIH